MYTDENFTDVQSILLKATSSVNEMRADGYPPDYYIIVVEEIAEACESLYTDWLRSRGKKENEIGSLLFLVRPYLSIRYFAHPSIRPVNIFSFKKKQRARFIEELVQELTEIPEKSFLKAMIEESLSTFETFLSTLNTQMMQ